MNNWVTILEVMQEAIKDAKKKYEANLAEESKFKNVGSSGQGGKWVIGIDK